MPRPKRAIRPQKPINQENAVARFLLGRAPLPIEHVRKANTIISRISRMPSTNRTQRWGVATYQAERLSPESKMPRLRSYASKKKFAGLSGGVSRKPKVPLHRAMVIKAVPDIYALFDELDNANTAAKRKLVKWKLEQAVARLAGTLYYADYVKTQEKARK